MQTHAKIPIILILKKPNFWGRIALRIIYFGGWLYDFTGNSGKDKGFKVED